ncbi:MAG TPA: chemotaxis protein CheD [Desulfuromonadaceae bacterium]|jgi:chemotaxis protein CheD
MKNLVDPQLQNVYLKPGEIYVSRVPALVSTVLGSCVSITLFSPESKAGAMCHALLPSGSIDEGFRYVDSTLDYMFSRLSAVSGRSSGFEAKLFGGADVLKPGGLLSGAPSVGSQNVEIALQVIKRLGMVLTASDTSGDRGRKIFFYSNTGEVFLRQVRKTIKTCEK